jgi:sulfite reductase (NADPH) flavoprotein alpha-component
MAPSIDSPGSPRNPSQKFVKTCHGPFPVSGDLMALADSFYASHQLLVEQVVYALSGAIFSYSPETFGLDNDVQEWVKLGQKSANGVTPQLYQLESRVGAACVVLGYIYGRSQSDSTPQSVVASSGTLEYMKPVLAQFSLEERVSSPLVFHVAALDYNQGKLESDYTPALEISRDLGLGLVASLSLEDAQHTAFLATVLSCVLPTIHVYDGVRGVRQNGRTENVLDAAQVSDLYEIAKKSIGSGSIKEKIRSVFNHINSQLRTAYKAFEYMGSQTAETVVVSLGSVEGVIGAQIAENPNFGAINVRLYSPFLEDEFLAALPALVKKVVVFGQVKSDSDVTNSKVHSSLFSEVSTAVVLKYGLAGNGPEIVDFKYSSGHVWRPAEVDKFFGTTHTVVPANQFVFWDVDTSKSVVAPSTLAHTLSFDPVNSVDYISTYDNETNAGVIKSEIRVSPSTINAPYSIQDADVVFVNDSRITSTVDVLAAAKHGAKVIVAAKDLEKDVSNSFKKNAAVKAVEIAVVDYDAIGENPETEGRTQSMIQQITFWRVAFPELSLNEITTKVVTANGVDTELVAATVASLAEKVVETAVTKVSIPEEWSKLDVPELGLPHDVYPNSFVPNQTSTDEEDSAPVAGSWTDAAKKLVFKEACGVSTDLRPDLPVKNYVAKVQVNERVTPEDYDRHIFHLELDITGTGLTYAIGEALGVHSPNDHEAVKQFIDWYGLDADQVVSVASRDVDSSYQESRTVYQVLRDNLDLYGKPPKKFFESLSQYATDAKEKLHLERLGCADGAAELKKRTEEDFATFVDILEEFRSARPSIEQLVQMVPVLKRREYSIASSQKVHPNAVHLLIVVVDWVDSKGRKRFGQCSKFLAGLSAGSEVVVSVKPSVMKLPASTTAPIIMSGLGTGLAPFKAFLEEKAWQKTQGHEIGDIYLFLGSRHQRQEYLYGELFEAYRNAGILTYIGAAFSRDQPQKIYIQDRIREAKDKLVDAFVKKTGNFYLCGPTWPVADISAALGDIVATEAAERGVTIDHSREIELLKEQERYILEVY